MCSPELGRHRARRAGRAAVVDRRVDHRRRLGPSRHLDEAAGPRPARRRGPPRSICTGAHHMSSRSSAAPHSERVFVAKISSSWSISSRQCSRRAIGRREPLVVDPLGMLDGAAQIGPVPVALEADEPEPAAVGVAVPVDERVPHRLRACRWRAGRPSRTEMLTSKPTVYIAVAQERRRARAGPCPVRSRATSAADTTAAASVMPAPWSPMPPRWNGG